MANILISGLVNTETTVRVRQFPIEYYPIDYPFFGVNTAVSGVGYNISKALRTLGDDVKLFAMTGDDFAAGYIRRELQALGVETGNVLPVLAQTPSSVVLYDESGRRQIYCDLKDIQESSYPFGEETVEGADIVVACNTNFNRPLLTMAKAMGRIIATDVHVLRDIHAPALEPLVTMLSVSICHRSALSITYSVAENKSSTAMFMALFITPIISRIDEPAAFFPKFFNPKR